MNQLEKKVLQVAEDLIERDCYTTTLDIKNQCRLLWPSEKFYQSDVYDIMDDLGLTNISNLDYTDTGKYRKYFIGATTHLNVNLTYIIKFLKDNIGNKITITFHKKDGSEITITGYQKGKTFISDFGYLNFITDKNEFKQVDPKKIISVTYDRKNYIVK